MTSYRGQYSKRALLEGQYSRGTNRSLMHPEMKRLVTQISVVLMVRVNGLGTVVCFEKSSTWLLEYDSEITQRVLYDGTGSAWVKHRCPILTRKCPKRLKTTKTFLPQKYEMAEILVGFSDNAGQTGERGLNILILTRRPWWMALNKISCYIVLTDQIKRHYFSEFPRYLPDFCGIFPTSTHSFICYLPFIPFHSNLTF